MHEWRAGITCLMLATVCAARSQTAQPPDLADAAAIRQIQEEGSARSQLTATVSALTDLYGPRLTGSPNLKAAADYVIDNAGHRAATEAQVRDVHAALLRDLAARRS